MFEHVLTTSFRPMLEYLEIRTCKVSFNILTVFDCVVDYLLEMKHEVTEIPCRANPIVRSVLHRDISSEIGSVPNTQIVRCICEARDSLE